MPEHRVSAILVLPRPRGSQGRYHGADFAWTYGMHTGHRFIGFAMRPFLLRRIHSAEKGRQTYLESLKDEVRTMIFYESPYRVVKTLQQFAEVFGDDRQVSCCREISKLHEESVRGTLAEVIAHFEETEPRGEFVIVLAGKDPKQLKEEMKEKKREERRQKKNGALRDEESNE